MKVYVVQAYPKSQPWDRDPLPEQVVFLNREWALMATDAIDHDPEYDGWGLAVSEVIAAPAEIEVTS